MEFTSIRLNSKYPSRRKLIAQQHPVPTAAANTHHPLSKDTNNHKMILLNIQYHRNVLRRHLDSKEIFECLSWNNKGIQSILALGLNLAMKVLSYYWLLGFEQLLIIIWNMFILGKFEIDMADNNSLQIYQAPPSNSGNGMGQWKAKLQPNSFAQNHAYKWNMYSKYFVSQHCQVHDSWTSECINEVRTGH